MSTTISAISEIRKADPMSTKSSMNAPGQAVKDALKESLQVTSLADIWSEPLRVDKKLSNANSWREVHEENKAALRPRLQDINTC